MKNLQRITFKCGQLKDQTNTLFHLLPAIWFAKIHTYSHLYYQVHIAFLFWAVGVQIKVIDYIKEYYKHENAN